MNLTEAQRARILEAFQAMDDYAWGTPVEPGWTAFYYDGYVTLAGLLHIAEVIRDLLAEPRQPSP